MKEGEIEPAANRLAVEVGGAPVNGAPANGPLSGNSAAMATEPSLLRALDANGNRAREALRVVEDYARFALNHDRLCERIKNLRHDLAAASAGWAEAAMLCRNTPGDVGTAISTDSEQRRENLSSVVIAAGKRAGEALRAIEELAKVIDPVAAQKVESIRYRFYDIEQAIERTLRPAELFAGVRLYVLITESACRRPWLAVAADAIAGGADCLQLREKETEGGELLRRARQLVALCHQHQVLCIINDRPDIAILSGADGVHVGQGDLPASEVRKLIGPGKILGVSTHELPQAEQAVLDGADYIGVGPVFRSPTKPRDISPGLPYAKAAAQKIRIPVVAIAGITEANVDEVMQTGVQAIAVTAAVTGCDDVRGAAERLRLKVPDPQTQNPIKTHWTKSQ